MNAESTRSDASCMFFPLPIVDLVGICVAFIELVVFVVVGNVIVVGVVELVEIIVPLLRAMFDDVLSSLKFRTIYNPPVDKNI